MATIPVFLFIGNSNMAGKEYITLVPNETWRSWVGNEAPYPSTYPKDNSVDDIKILSEKVPYGISDTRTITAVPATDKLTISGAALNATTDVDRWCYVATNTTGQGQIARVASVTGGTPETITFTAAFGTAVAANGTVEVWTDSHTVASYDSTVPSITKKTVAGVAFSTADVGKWLMIVSASGTNVQNRRIVAKLSDDTVQLERELGSVPSANDCLRVMSASGTVNSLSDFTSANCSWQPMRFYIDKSPTYSGPYDYSNWFGGLIESPYHYKTLDAINAVPECMTKLRSHYAEAPRAIICGIGGATVHPLPMNGTASILAYSWGADIDSVDFNPGSSLGLLNVVKTKVAIAKTLIEAENNVMDLKAVFVTLAENDAVMQKKADVFYDGMKSLRDHLRGWLAEGQYSLSSPEQIGWIMSDCGTTETVSTHPGEDTVNEALAMLAEDDIASGVIATVGYGHNSDGIHFNQNGYIELGSDFYDKWIEVEQRALDASASSSDLETLGTLRDRVKRRYERGTSANDASVAQIDFFINEALREVYLTLGNKAWFLRQRETVSISADYPSTLVLPARMKRVLRIEDSLRPGSRIDWDGLGYTQGGKLELTIKERISGTPIVHYIIPTKELVGPSDVCPIPQDHVDLIVVLACKGLAEASGNAATASLWANKLPKMWQTLNMDAGRYANAKQDTIDAAGSDGYTLLPSSWWKL